ncbi:hypothetical protein EB796_015452 [Bugula neritina]|uniref:Uncharacterized protein n=1 Tax=Bugula neritina TaxID=10212 RepID=A0A7J7JLC6_BUGNE|nr:hypothetical protein EB796_015452 [Bugula neritina]
MKDWFGRVSKLTVVLQSGNIKRVNEEWLWPLTVKEISKDHDSVLVTSLAAEKVGYHLDKDKAIAKY